MAAFFDFTALVHDALLNLPDPAPGQAAMQNVQLPDDVRQAVTLLALPLGSLSFAIGGLSSTGGLAPSNPGVPGKGISLLTTFTAPFLAATPIPGLTGVDASGPELVEPRDAVTDDLHVEKNIQKEPAKESTVVVQPGKKLVRALTAVASGDAKSQPPGSVRRRPRVRCATR